MKYKLDQIIFYMMINRVHSAPVLSRMMIENLHDEFADTEEQINVFTPFGHSGVKYSTCHGLFDESVCFASKEDLLKSL